MPAVVKTRHARHAQTPYTRKERPSKQPVDDAAMKDASNAGLLENAAKGLMKLVSWVFTSGEDLSKNVGNSASKVVHRVQPQRSLTSQLEDGILHGASERSDSLLAPDLVPHYLGKTPKVVKSRREPQQDAPKFPIPKFDSGRFKIPDLPTPTSEHRQYSYQDRDKRPLDVAPPRGRKLKTLEISADTQSRHDQEIVRWLFAHDLTPEDLASASNVNQFKVEHHDKLRRIMNDTGFFRRKGLFPPILDDAPRASTHLEPSHHARDDSSRKVEAKVRHRSVSRGSQMSLDKAGSDRSSTTIKGQHLDSRNWKTTSSTGILSAWRDICQRQESVAHNQALNLQSRSTRSRSGSAMSLQREPMLWHEDISFTTQKTDAEAHNTVPSIDVDTTEVRGSYWAPIESFPIPEENPQESRSAHDLASSLRIVPRHRRRHSRQASTARGSRPPTDHSQRTLRESRQQTPASAASSHRSNSRRPGISGPEESKQGNKRNVRSSGDSVAAKAVMVDSQVQTTDELMSFLIDEPSHSVPDSPSISKDRRKRPGCFSAIDEDMEDLFGPYSDVPLKRPRIDDQEEVVLRPRVTLLKESEEVKQLRAQQKEERAAMPPPVTLSGTHTAGRSQTTDNSSLPRSSTTNFSFGSTPAQIPDEAAQVKEVSDKTPSLNFNLATSETSQQAADVLSPKVNGLVGFSTTNIGTSKNVSGATPSGLDSAVAVEKAPTSNTEARDKASSNFSGFDFGHTPKKHDGSRSPVSTPSAADTGSVPKFVFGATVTDHQTADSPSQQTIPSSKVASFGSLSESSKQTPTGFAIEQSSTGLPTNSGSTLFNFGGTQDSAKETASISEDITSKISQDSGPVFGDQTTKSRSPFGIEKTVESKTTNGSSGLPTDKASGGSFRFGAEPSAVGSEPPASSTFSFGSQQTSKTAPSAPKFSFGAGSADPEGGKKDHNQTIFAFGQSKSPASTFEVTQPDVSAPFGNKAEQLPSSQPSNNLFAPQGPKSSASSGVASPAPTTVPLFGNAPKQAEKNASPFVFGATNENKPSATGFSFPAVGSTEEKKSTAFTFGTQAQSRSSNNNGPATTPALINTSHSASAPPPFGSPAPNANGPTAPPPFGSPAPTANSSTAPPPFGSSAPGANGSSVFSFGQSAPSAQAFQFGVSNAQGPTSGSTTGFNVQASQPAASSNSGFGATQANAPRSDFNFGSNGPAPTPSFNFGATASAAPASSNNVFGGFNQPSNPQPQQANTGAPSFQFGAQNQTQSAGQPFAFGQPQSAPGTGFASPAALSPSIQSATAPGSPNLFNFTPGNGAAPGAGAAAGGSRKIIQPRSRRPRPGGR